VTVFCLQVLEAKVAAVPVVIILDVWVFLTTGDAAFWEQNGLSELDLESNRMLVGESTFFDRLAETPGAV
jgi:hypothetical protein